MTESNVPHEYFINRELSWLEFNARVIEEAVDHSNPLLERVKFLSIASSNLDEFFMVRVAGLREQAFGAGAPQDPTADGMSPLTQLLRISERVRPMTANLYHCYNDSLLPALEQEGVQVFRNDELNARQRDHLDRFFRERAYPILTPMAVDPSHPSPRYHNRQLYLAAFIQRRGGLGPRQMFAVVQLPKALPRLVPLQEGLSDQFILLEDAISARMTDLFGGSEVMTWTTFRVTRDMDSELLDQEADDMLRLIEDRIRARERAQAVRLEVSEGGDESLVRMIVEAEEMYDGTDSASEHYSEVFHVSGPLALSDIRALSNVSGRSHLRYAPFAPKRPRGMKKSKGSMVFDEIAQRDILLHHPFDSFDPVVDFVRAAASDPNVLAIKQTLYRTSGDSPIVSALMQAAENGKQVTAVVELKARFDEANNVSWARRLEQAGVHVVFGFIDLKTHCKLSLVVRQERDSLRTYVHLSTGNYNPTTATLYTDIGLFTSDKEMTADVAALFNLLTGYCQGHRFTKLVVAPEELQLRTIELIEQQTQLARDGNPCWIFAKMNALVDREVIEALYRASQAGVPITLVPRGVCCLRPGVPGISSNIRVRSVVDRFLEHSRIFVFGRDDDARVFLASSDWMPRNFLRRVEVMFPVEDPVLRSRILEEIVPAYLQDNISARLLRSDGTYHRCQPAHGEAPYRVQEELLRLEARTLALHRSDSETRVPGLEAGRKVADI